MIRSDLGSVHDPVTALDAGTDLIKPSSVARLDLLVREHRLGMAAVNRAVVRILTVMFAHGLVDRPAAGSPGTAVDSDSHTDFALTAAERSAVLLQNTGALLPLAASAHRSVAVIGADASAAAGHHGIRQLPGHPPLHLLPAAGHTPKGREPYPGQLRRRRQHHRESPGRPLQLPDPGIGNRPRAHPDTDPDRS